MNTVPTILSALEPKGQVFLPLPQTQMVKLMVPFEMRNEKLQAVRMQRDTIQIDLEGTGKRTLRLALEKLQLKIEATL